MALKTYLRAVLPTLGLALFSLGSTQVLTSQGSNLGIPKLKPKKWGQGQGSGGDLVIPKGRKKRLGKGKGKGKDKESRGKGAMHDQKAQAFEIPENMPGLKSFVTALMTEENIGKEELVAMYDLISKEGRSKLMLLARKMDAASVAMLSRVYAAIPEKAVLPLFLARLRRARFGKYTDDIVESVVLLAEGRGVRVALEMIESRNRAVRMAALRSIRSRLSLLSLEELLPLLDSTSKSARAAVVGLLVDYLQRFPEKDIQALVDCLGHKDGRVRNEAAKGLINMMGRAQAPLLAILNTKRDRDEWYLAALLVGIEELLTGKPLLPKGLVRTVGNLSSAASPMRRGVAAVLQGLELFRSRDLSQGPDSLESLESLEGEEEVVTALIDTIGGKTWYPEYPLVHNASKGVTALLTGMAFGSDAIRWRAWWGQARAGFVPYTASVPLSDTDVLTARLLYRVDGVLKVAILGPKAMEPEKDQKNHRVIRLTARGFKRLYKKMLARGFLDMRARYDARKGYSLDRSLTIESGGKRAFDGFHGAENPRLLRLSAAFDRVRAMESWQQYLPTGLTHVEGEQWWAKNAKALDGLSGKERDAYILELACQVLVQLEEGVRKTALAWMRSLARDHEDLFGASEAETLVALAKEGGTSKAQVEAALEILAMVGDDSVFDECLGILIAREELELSLALPRLLGLGDPGRLLRVASHANPDVRAVAAREIAKLKYKKAYPALVGLLADKDLYVRVTAAQSCGRLKLQMARESLAKMTQDPVPAAQQNALLALAQMGGEGVYRALAKATTSQNKGVRIAAIRGLAMLSDSQAPSMLLDIAEAHYPEDLSLYALFGLSRRGGGELRAEIRLRLRRRVSEGLRKEYIYLLGEMQDPEAAVVEFILAEFKRGKTASRCCRILAAISGRDWCIQTNRAAKYADWFQANRDSTQAEWFLSALREQSFKTTLVRSDFVVGARLPVFEELCRILVEAPKWPLRALAAHFLRDLTGKDYGNVQPDTRPGALDALAERYRAFARSKNAVGGR